MSNWCLNLETTHLSYPKRPCQATVDLYDVWQMLVPKCCKTAHLGILLACVSWRLLKDEDLKRALTTFRVSIASRWPNKGLKRFTISGLQRQSDALPRNLKDHQYSIEGQKFHQTLAPVLVIISGTSLTFSRTIITSTGSFLVLRPDVSAPVVVKIQSPTTIVFFKLHPLLKLFSN